MHKSVPNILKVLTFGKVSQKILKDPKFCGGGGWGVRPVLDEVQIKAAFFLEKLPKWVELVNLRSVTNWANISSSHLYTKYNIIIRPGIAEAVLQSPPSLIN